MSGGTGFIPGNSIGDLDLQIGAVEIKDATSNDRANVVLRADGKYALCVDAVTTIDGIKVDDSLFTVAVDKVMPSGYINTTDSINAGDVGAARITLDRRQIMILDDGTQELDLTRIHSGYTATPVALPVSAKYETTPTVYNNGDAIPFTGTSDARLRVEAKIAFQDFDPIDSYFTYSVGNKVTQIVEVNDRGQSLVSAFTYTGNNVTQILQSVVP